MKRRSAATTLPAAPYNPTSRGSLPSSNSYIHTNATLFVALFARHSSKLLQEYSSPVDDHQVCLVATGFVARNTEGVSTTLGRDGSDYSASIFGRLLSASAIYIYTDVDGVLSADPRRVKGAKVLGEVSFNEAMELAYFGAKVIHPKTMQVRMGESRN